MPDHIHLLLDCRPQFRISDMVKIMKGNLARRLFLDHPELKKQLWGGHLWNPSYCAMTVSDRSCEQIMNGTIAVESEPGRGTTFTVILPMELDNGKNACQGDGKPGL